MLLCLFQNPHQLSLHESYRGPLADPRNKAINTPLAQLTVLFAEKPLLLGEPEAGVENDKPLEEPRTLFVPLLSPFQEHGTLDSALLYLEVKLQSATL